MPNEGNSNSLIHLNLGPAAKALVDKVSKGMGILFEPHRIVRKAKANAEAAIIEASGKADVRDIEWRAVQRLRHEETRKQENIEAIADQALLLLPVDAHPENLDEDWLAQFLDRAKLISNEEMQRAWSTLLVSASTQNNPQHLIFVDILSRLNSTELKLLEEVCFSYKGFPEVYYPGGHIEQNRQTVSAKANELLSEKQRDQKAAHVVFERLVKETEIVYGHIIHAKIPRMSGDSVLYTEYSPMYAAFKSLEILRRERILEIEHFKPAGPHGFDVGYFNVTELGVGFVYACSCRGKEMAERRPKPIDIGGAKNLNGAE